MEERVVVTGLGLVSSECISSEISKILDEKLLSSCKSKNKMIDNISDILEDHISYKIIRRICRFSQLALCSNVICRKDSKLNIIGENDRIGSIMNTSYGPLNVTEKLLNTIIHLGSQEVSPADFSNTVNNCATGQISISMALKGVSTTLVGSSAICYAYDLIKYGKADAILVSGVEEYNENVDKIANSKGCFTFENSSCLLLESYTHAIVREAKIYSEILNCDIFYVNENNAEKIYKEKMQQYENEAVVYGNTYLNNITFNNFKRTRDYFNTIPAFGYVFGAVELLNNLYAAAMIYENSYYTNTGDLKKNRINKDNKIVSMSIQQGGGCSIIVQTGVI